MKPTVGDPVHYFSRDSQEGCPLVPLAATITVVEVYPKSLLAVQPDDADPEDAGYYDVSLFVMYPCGSGSQREIPYSSTPRPGHWSWRPDGLK